MKQALSKIELKTWYYVDDKKVDGVHERISGDVWGIYGDVSGIRGNVSGISGNVSGIRGDVWGIYGDVDECELTAKERENGINITDLIK